MVRVLIALIPGFATTVWFYGYTIVFIVAISTVSAVLTEIACTRQLKDIRDGSAIVTGGLVGLCIPPTAGLWIPAIASAVGISLGKHVYGGLGKNLFNPAMVGYVFVLVCFPMQLTYFDAVTGATALEVISHKEGRTIDEISELAAFGLVGAQNFEWINLAFLVGGLYLLVTRIINWVIPFFLLVGLGLPAWLLFDGGSTHSLGSPLFHWFTGGTMLTTFFIATDPVTSPSRRLDQMIYGLFIGGLTLVIRQWGSAPDGLAYAILMANMLLPLLEQRKRTTKRTTQ